MLRSLLQTKSFAYIIIYLKSLFKGCFALVEWYEENQCEWGLGPQALGSSKHWEKSYTIKLWNKQICALSKTNWKDLFDEKKNNEQKLYMLLSPFTPCIHTPTPKPNFDVNPSYLPYTVGIWSIKPNTLFCLFLFLVFFLEENPWQTHTGFVKNCQNHTLCQHLLRTLSLLQCSWAGSRLQSSAYVPLCKSIGHKHILVLATCLSALLQLGFRCWNVFTK